MMKGIAMLAMTIGTVVASVALAPIPTMVRLFDSDLRAIASGVEMAVERDQKDPLADAVRGELRFLWVTDAARLKGLAEDLAQVRTTLETIEEAELISLVDRAERDWKGEAASPELLRKALRAAKALERQLIENLADAYPDRFPAMRVLGRTPADRRDALKSDLEVLSKAIGSTVSAELAHANTSLVGWDRRWKERSERHDNRWDNPIWSWFFGGFICMVAGIVLNRRIAGLEAAEDAEHTRRFGGDVQQSVEQLVTGVRDLVANLESIGDRELHRRVDELITGPAFDLVERRSVLETLLGPADYAMAMSTLASAERQLHRSWSALTDEYPDEARRSVRASLEKFEEFHQRVAGVLGKGGSAEG